ncbi:hypothetical protein LBMAG57_21730 [Verrucomicrobiota bacterium]|nr:hypothetical protein LBMAG57_21730 [Verrucomicrobiota bacterium]
MGRLIATIAFFACFLIFALIKSLAVGAKTAYKAVFNKPDLNENEQLTLAAALSIIDVGLKQYYDPNHRNLVQAVLTITPKVHDIITHQGYSVTLSDTRDMVLQLIPRVHVYVPQEQLVEAATQLRNRI